MKSKKVFIIIPGYNEEKRVGNVIKTIRHLGFKNIIFVDDGSSDKSSQIAKSAGADVLCHIINLGKGAAVKTGCDYALKQGANIIVLMDSDGQHRPEDIRRFLKKLEEEKSDIVFGYRIIDKNMPFVMKFGNWFISTATKIIQGIDIRDTQSGFRCMKSGTYRKIRWESTDYSMESEMIANVGKHKLKYSEIPINTIYLDNFKGTTIFDGIRIFINIIRFKVFGRK